MWLIYVDIYTELEINNSRPLANFLTKIAISAEQNLIARTNLLYISYGEAIIMFLLLINGQPISNPYFKLCIHINKEVKPSN